MSKLNLLHMGTKYYEIKSEIFSHTGKRGLDHTKDLFVTNSYNDIIICEFGIDNNILVNKLNLFDYLERF